MERSAAKSNSYFPIIEKTFPMKVLLLAAGFVMAFGLGSLNENAAPVPAEDRYCAVDGKSVDLKFKITQATADQVELALNEGQGKQNVYFQFGYGAGWGGKKWSLVMKSLDEKSKIRGNDRAKVAKFEKDNGGKPVNFYNLRHTIVEDNGGKLFMQMSYIGAAMPLLDELVVSQNFNIPKSIANRFGEKGTIQFQKGTYAADKSINGFRIPIKIL
jgi:hypothetical protein